MKKICKRVGRDLVLIAFMWMPFGFLLNWSVDTYCSFEFSACVSQEQFKELQETKAFLLSLKPGRTCNTEVFTNRIICRNEERSE